MRSFALAALALPLLAGTALAADEYVVEKTHATVAFEVNHLGFSDVTGTFDNVDGTLTLDEENPENSKVSITIDASSVDTGYDPRDEHVRNADFLDVPNHPEITFESTSVTRTGDETADVAGDLTILGTTQPVTLNVTLNQMGANPLSQVQTVGFDATAEIDRTAFGMETFAPAIGATLPVKISMEFVPAE